MIGRSRFSAILLAAGMSERMGKRNKLLIEINGTSMVRRSAELYRALGMPVTVVLGHEVERVGAALSDLELSFVWNPDFRLGQQSSVRAGLDAIELPDRGVLIALADQPLLTCDDIAAFCDAFIASGADKIMVPYFEGNRGNPVLFPTQLLESMRDAGGNPGCRKFIDRNPDLVRKYQAPNDHFIADIDTAEDVEGLLTLNK